MKPFILVIYEWHHSNRLAASPAGCAEEGKFVREAWKTYIAEQGKGTRVNQMLARYLLAHEDEVLFLTAQQLAERAGVSQGSVTRFCCALGCSGYSDFQKQLQQQHAAPSNAVERVQYLRQAQPSDIEIIESEKRGMDRLYDVVMGEDYKATAEALATAPQVCLMSARLSSTVMRYFYYGLCKLRDGVTLAEPDTVQWQTACCADPAAMFVLAVSFPRYSRQLVQQLRQMHRDGFAIAAVTDSPLSPVADCSRYPLYVPITHHSIFDVYSTPLLLLNLLLKDVAAHIPNLEQRMARLEAVESAQQVYEGVSDPSKVLQNSLKGSEYKA